jgi:hypothetical protein
LSIHEDLTPELEIKTSSNRSFGFVFTVVFAIIGLFSWFGDSGEVYIWAIAISAAFLVITLIRPGLLAPLNRIWTKFGLLLQKVVSPVVLGGMFYLILTPFGLAMRLLGKDPLRLKIDKKAESYWIHRTPPGPSPESMKNQY